MLKCNLIDKTFFEFFLRFISLKEKNERIKTNIYNQNKFILKNISKQIKKSVFLQTIF